MRAHIQRQFHGSADDLRNRQFVIIITLQFPEYERQILQFFNDEELKEYGISRDNLQDERMVLQSAFSSIDEAVAAENRITNGLKELNQRLSSCKKFIPANDAKGYADPEEIRL